MVWSTPKTYTAGAVLTAAELNQYQRDNFNETSAATVTTAGDLVYADAANSMGTRLAVGASGSLLVSDGSAPLWREVTQAKTNVAQSTSSTSYVDLSTVGPQVTVTTGTESLVFLTCAQSNDGVGFSAFMAVGISGATTRAATDDDALQLLSATAGASHRATRTTFLTGLTAGSNTFTAKYRTDSGGNPANFNLRQIIVIPFS